MYRRIGAVWVVAVWARLMIAAWAAPAVDSQHLQVEHRQSSLDIAASLPSASNDMFIWNGPDGSYRFGMQGHDQWRVESRDANGNVKGRYVYKTPDGQTVDISYDSGAQGYRARGDAIPGGAAPLSQEDDVGDQRIADVGDQRIADESIFSPAFPETPYGALLKVGAEQEFPTGNGVTTYTDDDNGAVITDVQASYSSPLAVFPLVQIPGTEDFFVGPALVNDKPLQAGAILI